jgi:DNA-binding phage protein
MLSEKGNPRLETLQALAKAFSWRLAFVDPRSKRLMKKAA